MNVATNRDPFNEIDCPICNESDFISIDYCKVYCSSCNTRFQIRPTAGDPGYVVDAYTDEVIKTKSVNTSLIGKDLFRIMKTNETPSRWIVSGISLERTFNIPSI
jgi:hypothetical protein